MQKMQSIEHLKLTEMATNYKIALDDTSRKFLCPLCSKKRFVRYLNQETKVYLPKNVGRCDREESCGYHFTPKQYFTDNPTDQTYNTTNAPIVTIEPKPINYIPYRFVKSSLKKYANNNFIAFLYNYILDTRTIVKLIARFKIGTSKIWNNNGATVFWQIDRSGNVRQAKIMLYNEHTGKRVKESNRIYFYGKKILQDQGVVNPNLKQCFFGEHQLTDTNKSIKVCIVESEKTAILMSAFVPENIWLATGGKNGCKWNTPDVFLVLTGRNILFYPDLGAYDSWNDKIELIKSYGINANISKLLENKASVEDKKQGFDIADYILFKKEHRK